MTIDTHNHSLTFSDGALTPEEIIKRGEEKGYKVGIADHLSKFWKIKTDIDLERYIFYLNKLSCYKSGEIDLGQEIIFSKELLNRLDYIIGGIHNLFWEGRWQSLWFMKEEIKEPDKFMELYKKAILKAIREPVIPMDILAHSTQLPPRLVRAFKEEVISDEWIEEVLLEAKEHDIAVEINNTEKIPSERFIKKALKIGVKISLGSDGHIGEDNVNLDWCLEMVEKVGITEDNLFKVRKERK